MAWLATIAPLAVVLIIILALAGLFVVRPIERCLVERFGKYNRFSQPGRRTGALLKGWENIRVLPIRDLIGLSPSLTGCTR